MIKYQLTALKHTYQLRGMVWWYLTWYAVKPLFAATPLSFERLVTRLPEHNFLFTKSLSTKLLNSLTTFPKASAWWRFDCTITGKRKRIVKNSLITQLLAFGLILESNWPYNVFCIPKNLFYYYIIEIYNTA